MVAVSTSGTRDLCLNWSTGWTCLALPYALEVATHTETMGFSADQVARSIFYTKTPVLEFV